MKTLYLDCRSGISGDMVLDALIQLSADPSSVQSQVDRIACTLDAANADDHGHFHRSYQDVQEIISHADVSEDARQTALDIYAVLAQAESAVHQMPLSALHFHEVGRNRAIANVLGVGICLDHLQASRIVCSEICDGQGTVVCAHGTLPVPVPAVRAMLDACDLPYRQTDQQGEMVTPSGLAMVLGMGAAHGLPSGKLLKTGQAKGARSFDTAGFVASLYDGDPPSE